MEISEAPVKEWLPADGPHVAYVAKLAMLGCVTGFSSGAARHFSLRQGLRPVREPDDLDLLVDKATFLEAFWMLPKNRRRLIPGKRTELMSADGARISLEADEITGWPHASGEGPAIQILRPFGPVKCEMPDGSTHFYDTSFDESLAAHSVHDGAMPYLHPEAAAALYVMYQRPLPKLDMYHALVLTQATQGLPSSGEVRSLMAGRGFGTPRIAHKMRWLGGAATLPIDRSILAVAA